MNQSTPAVSLAPEPVVADPLAEAALNPSETPVALAEDGGPPDPLPWWRALASACAIVLPFLGLTAAAILLWGVGFSWLHLFLLAGGYLLTAVGVTVGYHRLFTHKSFETNRVVTAILGVLGATAVEGPILEWVATHRRHHQHSDRPGDPHSPHAHEGAGEGLVAWARGFFHSHIGWFFHPHPRDLNRYVPDLAADPLIRWIDKLFPLWVALGALLPGVIAFAITGSWTAGLLGVLWGGVVRVFFVHHVTWSINSACHLWGSRPFRSHDHSRNNLVFGFLALGEGWHNNHHAFPTSARHGLKWWQFDLSYIIICALAAVGLAHNVRVPAPERIAAKSARTAG